MKQTSSRSYDVLTESGNRLRRNRCHLLQTKDQFTQKDDDKEGDSHEMISDKSRTWQDVLDHTKKSLFITAQRDHASESNESYVSLRRSSRNIKKPDRLTENI